MAQQTSVSSLLDMTSSSNVVFLGEAGSGKSEIALNFAQALAELGGKPVHFFDLDMTKPLFRSRDRREALEEMCIRDSSQGLPQHLVNVLQGGRPGAEGVDHVIHRSAVPVEQGGISPDGAGADVVAPHVQHSAAVRIVQPLPHAAGQGGGIHELGLVVDLHPQRPQGLAPVSGAEEGPVSYTHLDVYKRQGQSLGKAAR